MILSYSRLMRCACTYFGSSYMLSYLVGKWHHVT